MKVSLFLLLVLNMLFMPQIVTAAAPVNHRLIVLTDIEADPDDTESLVRLLVYANVLDIEGLIATTSTHMRNEVHPASILRVIDGYRKVRPCLLRHEPGFPRAEQLTRLVKAGLPVYGMQGVGEGKDSEGSDWIVTALADNDPRPLWVAVWGGSNCLAQALYKISHTRSEAAVAKMIAKLRVYTISDQDDSGQWIRTTYPGLFYIVSPGGYGGSIWAAITERAPGFNNEVISNAWIARNIQQGHGPLGALYPDVAYGMEGDTPSWLSLIPNGLNAPEHPDWGGWGGRYALSTPGLADIDAAGFTGGVPVEPETRPIWANATDRVLPIVHNVIGRAQDCDSVALTGFKQTLWRWREDLQNDFAARMDWCTMPYAQANHPPVPVLAHPDTITIRSGETYILDAMGSTDPDGDNLSFLWFPYPEAGSGKHTATIAGAWNIAHVQITAPVVESPETIHIILKVTDKGSPGLSRYKRVILTVLPAGAGSGQH